MKFLHTADWHLGKIFHGQHLTEDQSYVLDQLVDLVREEAPDAVLISGDVYDRAVPPPEAVRLLDDTLWRLSSLGTRVVMIAGNHDSASRLSFGARLLHHRQVYVTGQFEAAWRALELEDRYGAVRLFPLPYADPPEVSQQMEVAPLRTHEGAMAAMLQSARGMQRAGQRSIVLAHAFVEGGVGTESERPLAAFEGAETVNPALFEGFDYVALGHLHTPQHFGPRMHYPGSLMKYSFGEAEERKGVLMVQMDAQGQVEARTIPLSPRREVRRIRGFLSDLIQASQSGDPQDYLMATLYDDGDLVDPMGRLREYYPNLMRIERVQMDLARPLKERPDHRQRSHLEMFDAFFQEVTGAGLQPEESQVMARLLEELQRQQRESA